MLLGNMLLALAWAALQGEFSLRTLLTGQVLGYLKRGSDELRRYIALIPHRIP